MAVLIKKNIAIGFAVLGIVVGFLSGGAYVYNGQRPCEAYRNNSLDHATIIVSHGDGYPIVWHNAIIPKGANLFEILKAITEASKVEFSYKDYGGGMGVFINSIASSKNTKDKWWQYWVNGEYAKVGVSNYRPSSGDVIEFKLTGETIKNSQ